MSAPVPWREDVVARVASLHLRARQVVAGLGAGLRRSVRVGQAVEFADYKPYTPGDSLRDLDWRVLGRRDRLVVRRYRAETEMRATLVLDASGDLGSTGEKWDASVSIVATIAYLLFLENEPIGLHVAAGSGGTVLRPRRGRAQLARIFAALAALRPAGRADLATTLAAVGTRAHDRSLLVLVGDFMEPTGHWVGSLDALARRRVDLRAIQLYDRREFELDFPQPLKLYSPEGGADETLDPAAMRDSVREEAARFVAEVREGVRARRGVHQLVEARADLVSVIGEFLRGREGRFG